MFRRKCEKVMKSMQMYAVYNDCTAMFQTAVTPYWLHQFVCVMSRWKVYTRVLVEAN